MKKLIEILEQFKNERNEAKKNGTWDEDAVAKCFKPCAEQILCKGYFLVNGKYIIDLGAIELYYHEEKTNGIKDYKMYHTNEQLPESFKKRLETYPIEQLPIFYRKIKECGGGYPFFETGSFNLHQSGVDVTFENDDNENDKYRASFLIRSYRMIEKCDINKDILYDPCSSHLYDDLYYSGLLSFSSAPTIEWVEYDKGGNIEQKTRVNIKDERLWRFRRIGIKEIK